MLYKSALKTYLISLITLLIIPLMIIYISDPYMLFHKHWFHKELMHNNLRIQDYGLIKFGKFDSIIIGTSMLENTSADEASNKLGNHFANLSISGGSIYERFKVTNFALKQKSLKHIIFSLDYSFYKYHQTYETFISELYSWNSVIGYAKVYLTDRALECVFLNKDCWFQPYDLNRPNAWFNVDFHSRRFGGFGNWLKYVKEDEQIQDAFTQLRSSIDNYDSDAAQYKQIIDEEILPLFKYTNTTFSIIIPPYSALFWAKRKNSLKTLLKPYEYLLKKTVQMKNVKIYWFYDEDYVFDITKYKDLTHYHYSINSQQIDAIKNGTNILTIENYKDKFKKFSQKIRTFDLQTYLDKIPNY